MKKELVVGIAIIIIAILILHGVFQEDQEEWGGEGTLSLVVSLSSGSMSENGSINVTYILWNNGSTNMRVLFPTWLTPTDIITIRSDNGTTLDSNIEYEPPPDPTNADLVKLRPGENVTRVIEILHEDYPFETQERYSVIGEYSGIDRSTVSEPYWKGEILSNEEFFQVE